MSDTRTKIAEALVDVTNRWIAPNFPADHKLREFAELDEREQRLNLDYADAALGVIHAAPSAMTPTGDDDEENDLVWRLLHPLWSHGPTGPAHLDRDAAVSDMRQAAAEIQRLSAPLPSTASSDEPSHVMCIGWPTIRRLQAGEAVWFDDIQAGAVAADDLLEAVPLGSADSSRSDAMTGEPFTVDNAWQEILDKDDRNSPEEYPEMVMLTYEEFRDYMQRAALATRPSPAPAAPDQGVREALATSERLHRYHNNLPEAEICKKALATLSRPAPDAAGSEVPDEVKEIVDLYFAPWGAAKGARWEALSGDQPFNAEVAMHLIADALPRNERVPPHSVTGDQS